jgi:hypothetical protein
MILAASSAIWTLNPLSGALNGEHLSRCHPPSADLMNLSHVCPATLTNQDGGEYKPSLAYDPAQNLLSFTASFDTHGSAMEYPVVRASSFLLCCRFWLTIAPKVHLPFRLGAFSLLASFGCDFCEQSFLGPLRQCLLTLPRYELRTSFETIFSRLLHVWTEPFRLIDFFFLLVMRTFDVSTSLCWTFSLPFNYVQH